MQEERSAVPANATASPFAVAASTLQQPQAPRMTHAQLLAESEAKLDQNPAGLRWNLTPQNQV